MEIICQTLIVLSLLIFQAPIQEPNAAGGNVFRTGNGVAPPVLLTKVEPEYSEQARKARYEGAVMLSVRIDPTGAATNMKVTRSLGMGLDQKAMEAVAKWKFKPGMKQNQPVTVEATIEVNFHLLSDGWSIARAALVGVAGESEPVLKAVPAPPKCKSSNAKLTLSLNLHPDGSVGDVRVVSSSNTSLNHGIVDSVKKWTFEPVAVGSVPQSVGAKIDLVCRGH